MKAAPYASIEEHTVLELANTDCAAVTRSWAQNDRRMVQEGGPDFVRMNKLAALRQACIELMMLQLWQHMTYLERQDVKSMHMTH